LRWWLLRDPAPVATTDFTIDRLLSAYNRDLANALGNLASRALTLSRRDAAWRTVATTGVGADLRTQTAAPPAAVDQALTRYDFRTACEAIIALAEAGNRFIEDEAPWHLAKTADTGDTYAAQRFEAVIDTILAACRVAADELVPFIPNVATRLTTQLEPHQTKPAPAFPRITQQGTTT
jgi:methionyl-tRNA synthetase